MKSKGDSEYRWAIESMQDRMMMELENESVIPDEYRNLSKVGKCCRVGEMMKKNVNGIGECVPINLTTLDTAFSPYFNEFNMSGINAIGQQKDIFVAMIGDPCEYKRYMLEPEISNDDEHYLLSNGSIFGVNLSPSMLAPGIDYCIELVPGRGLRTLVCFHKEEQILSADFRLTFYACGLLISVPFLILTIMAYFITPKLMDVHGKALCYYCGCLTIAFTTLSIAQLASSHLSHQSCLSIAFIVQFSFIACFFWLNVMCIETYLLVRRYIRTGNSAAINPNRLFFYYSLWAWAPSVALIIISMIIDLNPTIPSTYIKPNFGAQSCWFESNVEAMPYFYVPVGFLVIFNIVLFAMTATAISRHQQALDLRRLREDRESNRQDRRTLSRLKRLFLVCLGLFFIMGMNWAMEVISWAAGGASLAWSAFDLVNALQGVIIFGIFVLRKSIRRLVWYQINKIRGIDCHEPETCSMECSLLTVLNVNGIPNERIL
ncbi:hypothetical protein PV326_010968 [Microctonus aethiopoides]|nr:hypothetical protein PV326_010968 [Microctonus aethiopoides]